MYRASSLHRVILNKLNTTILIQNKSSCKLDYKLNIKLFRFILCKWLTVYINRYYTRVQYEYILIQN